VSIGWSQPANNNSTGLALTAAEAVFSQLQGLVNLGYDSKNVTPGMFVTVQTGTDVTVRTAAISVERKAASKSKSKSKSKATRATTTTVYDTPGVKTRQFLQRTKSGQFGPRTMGPKSVQSRGDRSGNDSSDEVSQEEVVPHPSRECCCCVQNRTSGATLNSHVVDQRPVHSRCNHVIEHLIWYRRMLRSKTASCSAALASLRTIFAGLSVTSISTSCRRCSSSMRRQSLRRMRASEPR
jgi:hypothetical protein